MLKKIISLGLIVLMLFSLFLIMNHLFIVTASTRKLENETIETLRQNKEDLVCILKANKRTHQIGELPDISLEIINKTDSTILMARCLDGSPYGFRLPFSQFNIRHQLLGEVESTFFGCGNFDPLKESDFQEVESGNGFNPYGGNSFCSIINFGFTKFMMPGIYELTYNYSTIGKEFLAPRNKESFQIDSNLKSWYFKEGRQVEYFRKKMELDKLDSLWNCVPKVDLQSNTITIEYNLFTFL